MDLRARVSIMFCSFFPSTSVDQPVHSDRKGDFAVLVKVISESCNESAEIFDLFRIGFVMDTVNESLAPELFTNKFSDSFICKTA